MLLVLPMARQVRALRALKQTTAQHHRDHDPARLELDRPDPHPGQAQQTRECGPDAHGRRPPARGRQHPRAYGPTRARLPNPRPHAPTAKKTRSEQQNRAGQSPQLTYDHTESSTRECPRNCVGTSERDRYAYYYAGSHGVAGAHVPRRRGAQRAGGRAERTAGGVPAAVAPAAAAGGSSPELVDEALDRAAAAVGRSSSERPSDQRISDEVIDELLAGASTEEEIAGPGGLLAQLTKRLVERAMEVELTDHVGYEPHQEPPVGRGTAQRHDPEDADHRARGGGDRRSARPRRQLLSRRSSRSASGASRGSTRRSSRSIARSVDA